MWHVVIGGFRQNEGLKTGQIKLWEYLEQRIGDTPGVRVEYRDWLDDMGQLAGLISNQAGNRDHAELPAVVNLYAFSWGCPTAMVLAEHLQRHGIRVAYAVLADPVYRHRYAWGWWRAMIPVRWRWLTGWILPTTIYVPRNVGDVSQVIQRVNLPTAHDVVRLSRQTFMRPRLEVDVPHGEVDGSDDYLDRAEWAAIQMHHEYATRQQQRTL